MACNELKNARVRSCSMCYNGTAQTAAAAGTQVLILGTQLTDTGIGINTTAAGFEMTARGLYRIAYDVEFTNGDTAGAVTLNMLQNGAVLTAGAAAESVAAAGQTTLHGEVTIYNRCCGGTTITAQVIGSAGTVTGVTATCTKLQ